MTERWVLPTLPLLTRRFLLLDRGFLFLGQLVAPLIVGKPKIIGHRLGLALLDGAAFVKELLDEVFVGGGLGDLLHTGGVLWAEYKQLSVTTASVKVLLLGHRARGKAFKAKQYFSNSTENRWFE